MKKYLLTTAALFLWLSACLAQVNPALIAKEKEELAHASNDTARIRLLLAIGGGYRFSNIDSALYYIDETISLAQKIKSDELEAQGLSDKGSVILDSGDIPQAYIYMLQSLSAINKSNSESKFAAPVHGVVENRLGNLFMELGEYNTSIQHYRVSISYFASSQSLAVYNGVSNIGNDFELMGKLDSAKSYQQFVYNLFKRDSTGIFVVYGELEGRLGNVERDLHNYSKALRWYRYGAYNALRHTDLRNLSELYLNLGQTFGKLGQHDSSFYYARKTLEVSQRFSMKKSEYQAAALLSDLFKTTRQPDSALFYLSLSQKIKDDLFGPAIFRRLQRLALNEQQRQQQLQEDSIKYRLIFAEQKFQQQSLLAVQQRQKLLLNEQEISLANRQKDIDRLKFLKTQADLEAEKNLRLANAQQLKTANKQQALEQATLKLQKTEISSKRQQAYYLYAGIGGLLTLLIFIVRNYYNQRRLNKLLQDANERVIKTNHELAEQQEEIVTQRDNLEHAYGELKSTQTQLIQREKMASLGELTAGIAHEIQNPLNFVNNFSEVSAELIGELKEELQRGDIEEATAIATDVEQSLEKIRRHGKRADAIVKGMLQHSRASSGQKEPTDINALADEYLRLAYHGLRAKDKDFNAELITTFDPDLPKANVVPQDIGRVLLNLFNNAFYAVQQKAKTAWPEYKPTVEVNTAQQNGEVVISVKDNGPGIPDTIKDKIMQPFFTTKPTGEGTGLGLSLSYDIVVKGHGGAITIDTKAGEGAKFIIVFPSV